MAFLPRTEHFVWVYRRLREGYSAGLQPAGDWARRFLGLRPRLNIERAFGSCQTKEKVAQMTEYQQKLSFR
jgi:hypothetical protein